MTTVYLQIDKNVKISSESFCLKDVAKVSCSDKALEVKLKLLKIPARQINGPGRYVFSVMDVIEAIQREHPSVEVNNLGEADFVVTLEKSSHPGKLWLWMKTIFVAVLSFFGASFSIMAFNNDIDVTKLFGQIYLLFTGQESSSFTILEISYSIGLGMGIILFFNHFAKRKLTADPTPLEMEMHAYEDQINTTLIEADNRNPKNNQ